MQRPGPEKIWTFEFYFWKSRDRQMAMKKFKYVDINIVYVVNDQISPLITFPCENNWKTNIEYIEGFSGFLIGPARPIFSV